MPVLSSFALSTILIAPCAPKGGSPHFHVVSNVVNISSSLVFLCPNCYIRRRSRDGNGAVHVFMLMAMDAAAHGPLPRGAY